MYNLLLNPAKHLSSMIPFASLFRRCITFANFKYNAFYFHYYNQCLPGRYISGKDNPQYPFPQSLPALNSSEAPAGASVPVLDQKVATSGLLTFLAPSPHRPDLTFYIMG